MGRFITKRSEALCSKAMRKSDWENNAVTRDGWGQQLNEFDSDDGDDNDEENTKIQNDITMFQTALDINLSCLLRITLPLSIIP